MVMLSSYPPLLAIYSHCCNSFLDPHTKIKIKMYSWKKLEKIIGGWSAQKRIRKIDKGGSKIQGLKFLQYILE